jgi:predicted small lipoprotein YifL
MRRALLVFHAALAVICAAGCGGGGPDVSPDDGLPEGLDAPDLSQAEGEELPDTAPEPAQDLLPETPEEDIGQDLPVDPPADEGGVDETGLLVWYLDGAEVARSHGAEASATYLFLPTWGRNVQIYFPDSATLPTGTYGCDDYMAGPVNATLTTTDNTWAGLENLPDRWKTLTIAYCDTSGTYPDTVDMWVRFDETGSHLGGGFGCTIVGGGERAGETLTIEGTFNIDVP